MRFATRLAVTTLALAHTAAADSPRIAQVKTHPSQGDVTNVSGATARIMTHSDGLFVGFDTSGLAPDHVHTLWLVVIDDPEACYDMGAVETGLKTDPHACTSYEVLKRSGEVRSDVGYAGGAIVGDDGIAHLAFHQPEGPLSKGWFGHGLDSADTAEIHLVVNDHGPLLAGREAEMLGSYREGCSDASIPAPMPTTARADGTSGPNTCRLVQTAVFRLPVEGS